MGNCSLELSDVKPTYASAIVEEVDETVQELGPNAKGIVSDAGKMSDIKELAEKVKALVNKVNILFVNADTRSIKSLSDLPSRSSFQKTTTSPLRSWSIIFSSCGGDLLLPDTFSL